MERQPVVDRTFGYSTLADSQAKTSTPSSPVILTELTMRQLSAALGGCIILDGENAGEEAKKEKKGPRGGRREAWHPTEGEVAKVVDLVKRHARVEDIALEFHRGTATISAVFHRATGMTISDYRKADYKRHFKIK